MIMGSALLDDMEEVGSGEQVCSRVGQVYFEIYVISSVARIGNHHGVVAALVIANTVSRHRTRRGYERCVPSDARNRREVDFIARCMAEICDRVEVACARQGI